jgi:hypothetical protein
MVHARVWVWACRGARKRNKSAQNPLRPCVSLAPHILKKNQERANAHAPSGAADDLKSASDSTHPDPRLARAP